MFLLGGGFVAAAAARIRHNNANEKTFLFSRFRLSDGLFAIFPKQCFFPCRQARGQAATAN